MFNKKHISLIAFTLAEVLIVLGIIGIICEMTIPTLVQSTREQVAAAQLKKTYSTLSQAFNLAVQANGTPDNENWGNNSTDVFNKLIPYLKVTKNCGTGPGCFPPNVLYRKLDGGVDYDEAVFDTDTRYSRIQLNDGSSIAFFYVSWLAGSNDYGQFCIDINGPKPPNKYGIDVFIFEMFKDRINPCGTKINGHYSFPENCTKDGDPNASPTRNGLGCAAWVIYNGNMDYLHCSNLSWNGPTKCS